MTLEREKEPVQMIYFLQLTPLTSWLATNFLILLGRFHSVLTEIISPIVSGSFDSQRRLAGNYVEKCTPS